MPLNRHQIRNEYSLADPELYKVADKDDSEALLEGVAMAGLVGVLRQLGDLAEFAAEIFHDLHEEVMATSARGHGLIVRVQQLEAEFPSIERTLLSQTSHTAFLYNTGVDWHPNLRMDQSVVTREDLPRFVMDSYEECRGPPRLFLLDKFDVAGAGACLKRFTDPSFFKMESASLTGRKLGQRDKKTRRVKKRGPRWRNGDTPESYPSSHAKLHQLFLEERIESGINDPARRVKLKKRQFTGSLFEQDNVKSYMEKFLDTSPQEQKILHEICIDPLALTWKSDTVCETGLEIVEIGAISPVKESIDTDRSFCSSPEGREIVAKSSMGGFNQDKLNTLSDNKRAEVPGLYHESHDSNLSKISKVVSSEEIADRESMSEGSADGACDIDDVASEIDNYVDALANMESEFETDSDCKKNPHYLNVEPVMEDSDGSEKRRELRCVSLDSQSIGNSITSEDGDRLSKDRESSCSNSVNTLMETTTDLDVAVATIQASNSDSDNMLFDHHSTYEEILRKEREMHAAASIAHAAVDDILKSEEESGEALNTSSLADSNKKILPVDVKANLVDDPLPCPESEVSANLDVDLGEMDQGRTNQIDILHSHRTFSDTSEDSGHFVSVEPSVHDKDGPHCSVHCEASGGLLNNSDGLVHLPETDSHDAAGSLVEGHDMDFGAAELNACSDIGSSGKHSPVSVPMYQEKTKSIIMAHEEDCTPSTGKNSKDLCSATDSTASFGFHELLPGTKNSGHASLGSSAENLPCSWEDTSMEDDIAVSKEIVSFALHGCRAENLPGMSNQLHTSAREFPPGEITEAAKLANCGSFEADAAVVSSRDDSNSEISWSADNILQDSFKVGKPSPVLDPLEKQCEWLKMPLEATDSTLLELCPDEACEVYSGNDTGYSISVDGNPDKSQAFESDTVVDDRESQAAIILGEANVDHAPVDPHGDKDKIFSPDASPLNIPCEHNDSNVVASEDESHSNRHVGKVDHIETVADGSEQVDVVDDYHQNGSTLSLLPEKLHEPPLLVTKQFHQNDEVEQRRQIDPVQDASVTSNANMCNISSADSPTLHDGSLPEDVKSSENSAAEAKDLDSLGHALFEPQYVERESSIAVPGLHDDQPTLSKISPQSAEYMLDTSNVLVHGNNGMLSSGDQASQLENSGQPPRINLEPPSLPPLPPMQWRLGKFQNSAAAPAGRPVVQHTRVPVQVQPMGLPTMHHSLAPVQPIPLPAVHHTIASFQPVTLAAGNNTLTSIPPTILPLAPPAVHYAFSPLQSLVLPTSNYRTEINSRSLTNEGHLGYSDGYVAQQGVFALPMPVGVSEGLFQINTSAVGRQDNIPSTVPSVSTNLDAYVTQQGIYTPSNPFMVSEDSAHAKTGEVGRQDHVPITVSSASTSLNGTQISEDSRQPNVDPPESGSLIGHFSENSSTLETKVDTETSIQNELVGHSPQVSEEVANSYSQPLVDQAPPGLVAPEAGRTWSSEYDEIPSYADGNINGTLQKKLPRPRNPLIVEVVSIDKSKLRKVERTKPPLESKPEEGESILEQMQLRKVERVKPPVESKEEGGEYLEQLQLRKVGERVKPPVDTKAEEEFLPEQLQLRKVGDRVKSPVDPKSEEREFLLEQLQLRKVGVKSQQEVEPKVEEINSPMAQLRKVRERVREELELKTEETESPRMLLRKSFNLKPAVAARPNIQGPRTNLKVAAILEKASTIRQAMAGSDEDGDEDSWSDS
uniref:Protein SCAR n=1 Tax=Chenopodium quinoa TaxID=63459 RepID=A0A803MB89_CHEQI